MDSEEKCKDREKPLHYLKGEQKTNKIKVLIAEIPFLSLCKL